MLTRTKNNLDKKNEESLLTEWLVISRRGIPVSKVNLLGSVQCIKKSDCRVSPE